MGEQFIPPLSSTELDEAADAAAGIVTRCTIVFDDGFIGAAELLTLIKRNFTRGSVVNLNSEGLCAVLAHPTIRKVLQGCGFMFELTKTSNDRFNHRSSGESFWMYRLGSNVSNRQLPAAGSVRC